MVTYTGVDATAEQVKAFFDREISEIHRHVGFVNKDVTAFASQLPQDLHNAVEARKAELLRDRGLEGTLGISVRRRPDAPARPVPVTRKRLDLQRTQRQSAPAPPYRDEPALDQAHYEEILDVILAMGRAFGRSPEHLR